MTGDVMQCRPDTRQAVSFEHRKPGEDDAAYVQRMASNQWYCDATDDELADIMGLERDTVREHRKAFLESAAVGEMMAMLKATYLKLDRPLPTLREMLASALAQYEHAHAELDAEVARRIAAYEARQIQAQPARRSTGRGSISKRDGRSREAAAV